MTYNYYFYKFYDSLDLGFDRGNSYARGRVASDLRTTAGVDRFVTFRKRFAFEAMAAPKRIG